MTTPATPTAEEMIAFIESVIATGQDFEAWKSFETYGVRGITGEIHEGLSFPEAIAAAMRETSEPR